MCLSVFAQIDGIASPLIHFSVGRCILATGCLSVAAGALMLSDVCVSVISFTWMPATRVVHPFCVPQCSIFLQQRILQSYEGLFSLIHLRFTELTEEGSRTNTFPFFRDGSALEVIETGKYNVLMWLLTVSVKVNFFLLKLFFRNNQPRGHI